MDRQSILERMGWIFSRVRSTEFFRNPERALKPVFEKLQSLEIAATKSRVASNEKSNAPGDLIERVARRAEKLRSAWSNQESTSSRRQPALRSAAQASVS
jgi:hypothetical protein